MSGLVFHGGGVAEAAKAYGRPVSEWLDLSTGINPCPPELPALDPSLWLRLPDEDLFQSARQAAARYYGSGDILPIASAGTQPLIRLLAQKANKARRVAILSPTYGEYRAVFRAAGFEVDEISDFSAVNEDHGTVVVVNPNNPDGRTYSRADLLALSLDLSAGGAMLIVDEAFGDLVPHCSLAGDVSANPHLVVLRSFGKFFGLAGLRLSFAIAGEDYAAVLEEGLGPWPASGPALAIASSFFAMDTKALAAQIHEKSQDLRTVLKNAGLEIAGGTDLFCLVRQENARDLHDHLCRDGILTRRFDYRPDWIRIGLCANSDDLQRLSVSLERWT